MDLPAEPINPTPNAHNMMVPVNSLNWRGKVCLLLGTILNIGVFKFVATAIRFPETPLSSVSLLQQPSPVIALLAILLTILICTTAGTIIAGSIREDAGLFCACGALIFLSTRGGTLRETLLASSGDKVYLQLALESTAFVVMVSLAAGVISLFRQIAWVSDDDLNDGFTRSIESPAAKAGALIVSLTAYLAIVFLLAQSDRKSQVLAASAIAGVLSTLLAHYLFPVKPAGCFYLTPLLCGIIGQLAVYLTHPAGIEVGHVYSVLAPFARVLPIDHASAGVVGALAGYWLSRRMHVVDGED